MGERKERDYQIMDGRLNICQERFVGLINNNKMFVMEVNIGGALYT